MGLNLIRRLRLAASSFANPDQWFVRLFHGQASATGIYVDPDSARSVAAVFAATQIICEGLATLPLHIYRRLPGGGKDRATDHPLYRILHAQPNAYQTAVEFWEMMAGHAVLRGHCFSQKIENRRGELLQLLPLHPGRLTVDLITGPEVLYRYQPRQGPPRTFLPDELFRVLVQSCDGWTGTSRIETAKEAVALAIAAERFGAKFFAQGAAPSGVLQSPKGLSDVARKRLVEGWNAEQAGVDNSNKTAVLEEGITWQQVGMKLSDAQFLEARKYQVTEIARLFRVPPHMLADLDRATFSNIEQQSLEFVVYCLRPWLVRFEQAIWRDLLSASEQDNVFAEFLVAGLLRGDLASRYTAYAQGRQWGWLNADEIRELENLNPLPDGQGQEYLTPMNMVPADQLNPSPSQRKGTAERQARAAIAGVVRETLRRTMRREAQLGKDLVAAYERHGPVMLAALEPALQPLLPLVAQLLGGRFPEGATPGLRSLLEQWIARYLSIALERWHGRSVPDRIAELEAGPEDSTVNDLAERVLQFIIGATLAAAA